MNLQRVDAKPPYTLPCGHERRKVTGAVGRHPLARCSVCKTRYVAIVAPARLTAGYVSVKIELEGVAA